MKKLIDSTARKTLLVLFSITKSLGIPAPKFIAKHVHYRGIVNVATGDGDRFLMQSYGHAIENRLYWYGKRGHEPETFLPWLKAAKSANVVLDIGANTALYSLGAASKNASAEIHAFEPLPRVAEYAQNNATLNKSFNITVHQNAVCDELGEVTLHDPGGDQPASASLRSDFLDCEKETVIVRAIRIDDFVKEQGLQRVDLIKLDVEGIEEIALRGMKETIDRFMPTLFIEVLDGRPELMKELKRLVDLGYQVGDLRESGVVPYSLDETKGQERNLLFTTDLSQFS